ncbi:MAG: hypothetical protein CL917_11075 [Deltaproteobacteria bacterium]|nr:hypothetical protein [Deltaproteobacteria bacterium]
MAIAAIATALLSLAGTCNHAPTQPRILSPEANQLLRSVDRFQVEVEASGEYFDIGSLLVELNGKPLEITPGNTVHFAKLQKGEVLQEWNQLVVSAVRLADQERGESIRTFSWKEKPLPSSFQSDFVTRPPDVVSAEIEVLDTKIKRQNALLRVRFGQNMDIPEKIPFRVDQDNFIEFEDSGQGDDREKGDGLYTARIDFDYNNYFSRKYREIVGGFDQEEEIESISFSGRELIGVKAVDIPSALRDLVSPSIISLVPMAASTPVVDSERALMIRDLSVVADPLRTFDPCDTDGDGLNGDPNGAWSFKTLMTGMANTAATGVSVEAFTMGWLKGWATNFDVLNDGSPSGDWIINGDVVPNREVGLFNQIISLWPLDAAGNLDLDQAPFRLLSIVNRVDLRDAVGYGSSPASAGELRFVFGLLDMNVCQPARMTAIFEYAVTANSCSDVLAHAQSWEDLDLANAPFPATPAYLVDLQNITDPVTSPGVVPSRPNGSSIGQVRTSEVVMGTPWEMREFTLQPIPGGFPGQHELRMETTKQTPDIDYTLDPAMQLSLTNYINVNSPDICNGTHVVPDTWLGAPFLSGRSDFFPGTHFFSPGITPSVGVPCTPDDLRFNFSSNTCSGCHGADTIDPAVDSPFYHVHPDTPPGIPVELSRFLTGTGASPIPDPSPIGGVPRDFADLDRRAVDMQNLLALGCSTVTVSSAAMSVSVH